VRARGVLLRVQSAAHLEEVRSLRGTVKLWLNPVRVAWTADLKPAEVRHALQLVEEYQTYLLEKWNEFFRGANP